MPGQVISLAELLLALCITGNLLVVAWVSYQAIYCCALVPV